MAADPSLYDLTIDLLNVLGATYLSLRREIQQMRQADPRKNAARVRTFLEQSLGEGCLDSIVWGDANISPQGTTGYIPLHYRGAFFVLEIQKNGRTFEPRLHNESGGRSRHY